MKRPLARPPALDQVGGFLRHLLADHAARLLLEHPDHLVDDGGAHAGVGHRRGVGRSLLGSLEERGGGGGGGGAFLGLLALLTSHGN